MLREWAPTVYTYNIIKYSLQDDTVWDVSSISLVKTAVNRAQKILKPREIARVSFVSEACF